MSRDATIAAFARTAGYGDATITLLAQDASFRRYLRVTGGPAPAVIMDAPPDHEDVRPFLVIQARLAQAGLSVPAILATDVGEGLLLLEDLGDTLFPAVLTPQTQDALYEAATETLAALHRVAPPSGLKPWLAAEMAPATAATFLDWWWPAMFGAPPTDAIRTAFLHAMHRMLAPLEDAPHRLLHRDYFAGNLFWLPERRGIRRVGVIDFQDAAIGPPAYDLVSLVQDARRDLPASYASRMTDLYLAGTQQNRTAFDASFAICAAQRHLRVACLWVRLARRDNKPAYLQHGPRCWAMLEAALTHPATAPLAAFLNAHVPPSRRRNP